MKSKHFPLLLAVLSVFPFSLSPSQARLAAWFPLNDNFGDHVAVPELAGQLDGFPVRPELIRRGHPSFRPDLGGAYHFTNGGGLNLGGTEAVLPSDQFTISLWIQPSAVGALDRLIETQVGGANIQKGLRLDLGPAPGQRLRALLRDGGTTSTQVTHPLDLRTDGTWYFVAVRYDSAAGDGSALRLTVVEAVDPAVTPESITAATAQASSLGTGPLGYPHARSTALAGLELEAGNDTNFQGALDEIAFFDNADGAGVLEDAGLAAVYNHGPGGTRLIQSFTAGAASVAVNGAVTLSWSVEPEVDTLTLEDGRGLVTEVLTPGSNGTGTLTVNPDAPAVYTLRAGSGVKSQVAAVSVVAGEPVISRFHFQPPLVQAGGSTVLSWNVAGADTVVLEPGNLTVPASSRLEVSPAEAAAYTLRAQNAQGTAQASAKVRVTGGLPPAHSWVASSTLNTLTLWADDTGFRHWPLTGLFHHPELERPSPGTRLTGSYQSLDTFSASGITVPGFQYNNATVELWVRPDTAQLGADHQLIFETGGGQNGSSVLITQSGIRFLGSAANVRTVDLTLPLAGLFLDDFLHVVYTTDSPAGIFTATVRDVSGQTVTGTAEGKVVHGSNAASLFRLQGAEVNLGGRTEATGVTPEGLTGFAGEIAAFSIHSRVLTEEEILAAHRGVVPENENLIAGFTTSTTLLEPGVPATLSWQVAGPLDSLTLLDNRGGSTDLLPLTSQNQGTYAVTPAEATTYTLRATRGSLLRSASVEIFAGLPVIHSFTASRPWLLTGESATLTWNVAGATSVTLSPEGQAGSAESGQTVTPAATTTYTLTATNPSGHSTAEITLPVSALPVPAHGHVASTEGNDEFTWLDEAGTRSWTLSGLTRQTPLDPRSRLAGLTAAYQPWDNTGFTGVKNTSYRYDEITVELWARPDLSTLGTGHQVLFENGGGQNGHAVLLTRDHVRFIGSSGNARTVDVTVPLAGLKLDDFLHIAWAISTPAQSVEITVRDTEGHVAAQTAAGRVSQGGNEAGIFRFAGGEVNLGGRTEAADSSPEGLSGFTGSIAVLKVYDRVLPGTAIEKSWQAVIDQGTTPPVTPGPRIPVHSFSYDPATHQVTVDWEVTANAWYAAEFSTDLKEWQELEDTPFQVTGTGRTFTLPAGLPAAFVRIRAAAAP